MSKTKTKIKTRFTNSKQCPNCGYYKAKKKVIRTYGTKIDENFGERVANIIFSAGISLIVCFLFVLVPINTYSGNMGGDTVWYFLSALILMYWFLRKKVLTATEKADMMDRKSYDEEFTCLECGNTWS